jgi:acyl-CoA synthetase (AMP-forming)/AMP-acid ligase II
LAVVPHDGVELSAEEVLAFGRTRLADYKIPSEVLVTREHFQRNAMGKVDRNALRKAYAARG